MLCNFVNLANRGGWLAYMPGRPHLASRTCREVRIVPRRGRASAPISRRQFCRELASKWCLICFVWVCSIWVDGYVHATVPFAQIHLYWWLLSPTDAFCQGSGTEIKLLMVRFAGNDCSYQGLGPATHGRPFEGDLSAQRSAANITWRARRKRGRQRKFVVHNFLFCQVTNVKPLEIVSFHFCHIYLGLGKLPHLPNKLCKTVGDALKWYFSKVMQDVWTVNLIFLFYPNNNLSNDVNI